MGREQHRRVDKKEDPLKELYACVNLTTVFFFLFFAYLRYLDNITHIFRYNSRHGINDVFTVCVRPSLPGSVTSVCR